MHVYIIICMIYMSDHHGTSKKRLGHFVDFGQFRSPSVCFQVHSKALFPFGFGLSYTSFTLSVPTLSSSSMTWDGTLTISTQAGEFWGSCCLPWFFLWFLFREFLFGFLVKP